MNNIFQTTSVALVVILAVFSINTAQANESRYNTQHDKHSHKHEEGVSLSAEKIKLAGIKIGEILR